MFTVLLRKASGAGYYALAGLPYEPVVQLSTTIARLAVMEGRTLAIAAYNTKLDDDFQIATQDPAERQKIEQGMRDTEARIESDMDPYKSAAQMDTPTRSSRSASCGAGSSSSRRPRTSRTRAAQNPRIWSLHDLAALTEPRG